MFKKLFKKLIEKKETGFTPVDTTVVGYDELVSDLGL